MGGGVTSAREDAARIVWLSECLPNWIDLVGGKAGVLQR